MLEESTNHLRMKQIHNQALDVGISVTASAAAAAAPNKWVSLTLAVVY